MPDFAEPDNAGRGDGFASPIDRGGAAWNG